MKKTLLYLSFLFLSGMSYAQNILLVDDNDYITDNSDTLIETLQLTTYSTFDYYKIADSSSNPSAAFLSNYDLVIWYASTDGAGLGLWVDSAEVDPDLMDYLLSDGKAWIIGSDLLYAGGFNTGTTFASGDFAFDFLGLDSYDSQSFGDDGGIGVASLNLSSGAPTYFPPTIGWIFSTAWWVDGVTGRNNTRKIYEMGNLSGTYPLAGKTTMLHYVDPITNVLSSYFDPALISTRVDRKNFLEKSIFYILNYDLGLNETNFTDFKLSPNPCAEYLSIDMKNGTNAQYELTSSNGIVVRSGTIDGMNSKISVDNLSAGMYFLTVDGTTKQVVKL